MSIKITRVVCVFVLSAILMSFAGEEQQESPVRALYRKILREESDKDQDLKTTLKAVMGEYGLNPYVLYNLAKAYEEGILDGNPITKYEERSQALYQLVHEICLKRMDENDAKATYYAYQSALALDEETRPDLLIQAAITGYAVAQREVCEELGRIFHDLKEGEDIQDSNEVFIREYFRQTGLETTVKTPWKDKALLLEKLPGEFYRWAYLAAVQKDPYACARLGYYYKTGLGVEKNVKLGLLWYMYSLTIQENAGLSDALGELPDKVFTQYNLDPNWWDSSTWEWKLAPIPQNRDFDLKQP